MIKIYYHHYDKSNHTIYYKLYLKLDNSMYYILRFIAILLRLIPRRIGLQFGRLLGAIFYYLIPVRKKIAQKNISLAFPNLTESETKILIKNCYKHFGLVLVDFLRMPALNKKNIKKVFSFDDDSIELLKTHNGAIIMTGHIGNWEMFIPGFGLNDFQMSIVTQTQKNKSGERFFNWIRNKENTQLIPKKSSKEIMKQVLIENKFLGLASDQNAGKYGMQVPFFNSNVSIPKGAGYFYIKTKKPIFIGFCILKSNLTYELKLIKINETIINDNKNDLIYNVNQYFSNLLEKEIIKYPEQYFWFHKKWPKNIY